MMATTTSGATTYTDYNGNKTIVYSDGFVLYNGKPVASAKTASVISTAKATDTDSIAFKQRAANAAAGVVSNGLATTQSGMATSFPEVDAALASAKSISDARQNQQTMQDLYGASNPDFDPRIKSWEKSGLGGATLLQRGSISQAPDYAKNSGLRKPFSCNFLYNPPEIRVSYQGNTSVFPAQYQTGDSQAAAPVLSAMQTIDFALMFDRTYEVCGLAGMNSRGTRKGTYISGVYDDVAALERVGGILRDGSMYNGAGPLLPIPAVLMFGLGTSGFSGNAMQFFGYMSSMVVDYTHFSIGMVPMRAEVSISFAQLAMNSSGTAQNPTWLDPSTAAGSVATG